jgi:hypothetical protein
MSANYTYGEKIGAVVEMLFFPGFFAGSDLLFSFVFRSDKKVFQGIKITPVENTYTLSVGMLYLVEKVVI